MVPAFVVLAALDEETAAILRHINSKRLPRTLPIFSACYELDLSEKIESPRRRGILAQLGRMGRLSAAVSTVHAIHAWQPSIVMVAGTAGSFRGQGVMLGDVLVATEIVDYETQRLDDGPTVRWASYLPEQALLDRARQASLSMSSDGHPQVHFGPIMSGDKIVASEAVVKQLLGWRPDVLGVEMEGSGVAFAAAASSVPFLMIRGVVDYADRKKREDAEKWSPAACESVARFIRTFLLLWAQEPAVPERVMR